MTTETLTKKMGELEQRVASLERTLPRSTTIERESTTPSYCVGSYQALARLKGLLKKSHGEDPLRYQRRIRKASERTF